MRYLTVTSKNGSKLSISIYFRFLIADESYMFHAGIISRVKILSKTIYAYLMRNKAEHRASLINGVIESISECLHNFSKKLFFSQEEGHAIWAFGIFSLEASLNEL